MDVVVRPKPITFAELAERVAAHREDELSPGVRRNHKSLLKVHLNPVFGRTPVDQITPERVDRWWSSRTERAHPVTRKAAGHLLRTILRFGVKWKYIEKSPFEVEKASARVGSARPDFTLAQFRTVVAHLRPETARAAWVLFSGHLRLGELCGLQVGDLDTDTGLLQIERQLREVGGRHIALPKTGEEREVYMLTPGVAAFREQTATRPTAPETPLFPGVRTERMGARLFRRQWQAAALAAGVQNFHVHDVRHCSLTYAAQHNGVTLKEVMDRGGHSTPEAALRYQGATTERHAQVAAAVSATLMQG
jgi:integrase